MAATFGQFPAIFWFSGALLIATTVSVSITVRGSSETSGGCSIDHPSNMGGILQECARFWINWRKTNLCMKYFLIVCQFCRGFFDADNWSVEMSSLHWTWFSPYSGFQLINTDIGFHLKSGFKKRWATQTMLFTKKLSTQTIPLLQASASASVKMSVRLFVCLCVW